MKLVIIIFFIRDEGLQLINSTPQENITFGDPLAAGDPLSYGQDTTLAKNLNLTHEKTIQNFEDLENRNIVSVFSILR